MIIYSDRINNETYSFGRSLGITMFEIIIGRTPFEKNVTEEFLTPESAEAVDIVIDLLAEHRITEPYRSTTSVRQAEFSSNRTSSRWHWKI